MSMACWPRSGGRSVSRAPRSETTRQTRGCVCCTASSPSQWIGPPRATHPCSPRPRSTDRGTGRHGGSTVTGSEHLWAIGYDDMRRADEVREEIVRLGWVQTHLLLEDVAVVVRHPDGSFTLDRERFPAASNVLGCSAVGFLAGLVLGVPLVGAAIGAMVGGVATTRVMASAGIGADFVKEVQGLMTPGTSALFVLDSEGDMDTILHGIRGLGGTVLKTNVSVERARLIQSTLAPPTAPNE